MKRKVEVEDSLPDRVESAIADVRDQLTEYLDDNPDTDGVPCLSNDLDYSGAIHEIVDGSVPIYTKEIDDTYYLYGRELDEAYERAGLGDGKEDNHIAVCIYCYIYEAVVEWYQNNAEDVCNEWRLKRAIKLAESLTIEQCGEVLDLTLPDLENHYGDRTDVENLRGHIIGKLTGGELEPQTILDL